MGILTEPADRDQRLLPAPRQAILGAAVSPRLPRRQDQRLEILGAGAPPQRSAKVRPLLRVETEIPQSVRGEAAAVAVGAEGRGGGGDDSEHRAIGQAVTV